MNHNLIDLYPSLALNVDNGQLTFHFDPISVCQVEGVVTNFPPHLVSVPVPVYECHIDSEGREKADAIPLACEVSQR